MILAYGPAFTPKPNVTLSAQHLWNLWNLWENTTRGIGVSFFIAQLHVHSVVLSKKAAQDCTHASRPRWPKSWRELIICRGNRFFCCENSSFFNMLIRILKKNTIFATNNTTETTRPYNQDNKTKTSKPIDYKFWVNYCFSRSTPGMGRLLFYVL